MIWRSVRGRGEGEEGGARSRRYDLELHDLTYRPTPERTVLDRVSVAFPTKVTALVGRSGSGRTTILRLVSRLFDPQDGRVTIGGVDIRDVKLEDLRSMIATVSQFPLFVEADVRENLRLAVPEATDAAMETACRAADLWAALERIAPSDPLGAPVPRMAGKSGLAGGERRRLAIARALLAEPRISPGRALDRHRRVSVAKIVDTIRSAKSGDGALVDHDMDLVAALSTRLRLEDGRFTDIGTPSELAARRACSQNWRRRRRPTPTQRSSSSRLMPLRPARSPDSRKVPRARPGGDGKTPPGQAGLGQRSRRPGKGA